MLYNIVCLIFINHFLDGKIGPVSWIVIIREMINGKIGNTASAGFKKKFQDDKCICSFQCINLHATLSKITQYIE
jgi:hypothetical protein